MLDENGDRAFTASFEYLTKEGLCRCLDILFLASSFQDAAKSSQRFWLGRQKAVPEFFGTLLCLKVWGQHINQIDRDGNYHTGISGGFEWKRDWGVTLDQQIELMD